MSEIDSILSAFIDDWNAGRRPSVREYLRRAPAGAGRDELASDIEAWLSVAPTPDYDEATRAAIRAEPVVQAVLTGAGADAGLWPELLPSLRERARLSVGQVAAGLVQRCSLAKSDVPRTADYLGRLERGELEPSRVSRRLIDALAEVLGASPGTLWDAGAFGRGLRPAAAGGTLFRADGTAESWVAEDLEVLSQAALQPAPPALDEVDRLFLGGPEG